MCLVSEKDFREEGTDELRCIILVTNTHTQRQNKVALLLFVCSTRAVGTVFCHMIIKCIIIFPLFILMSFRLLHFTPVFATLYATREVYYIPSLHNKSLWPNRAHFRSDHRTTQFMILQWCHWWLLLCTAVISLRKLCCQCFMFMPRGKYFFSRGKQAM